MKEKSNDLKNSTRCMVTGGAGFIGSNLVNELMGQGNDVTVIDDLSTGKLSNIEPVSNKIKFHQKSITEDLDGMLDGIDTVYHLAALARVPLSIKYPVKTANVNILGTINLLEACRKADVRRVVFASSSSVYGESVQLPQTEDHPLSPKSPYAASKLAGEHYLRAYHRLYDLETVCLRLFNVYGSGLTADSPYSLVMPKFIEQAKRGEPLVMHGDGSQTRDFTHVSDVVEACVAAAKSDSAPGKVYNIGRGERTSILELANIIRDFLKSNSEIKFSEPREGDVTHTQADISAARRDLGFEPRFNLKEGIAKILR